MNRRAIVDGNEAVASVAFRMSETIAIYPITPSSNMAEVCDEWAAKGQRNLWGAIPEVSELQSEGGAAGAVHGALQAGALSTTFTASQGLLLMIPNMYKIAGELTAFCMHVSARALATHALSIFGDHSDVMSVRQTGFALLSSDSVQEAHDMAAIGHLSTLESRVPFLHFFDGFRTSHEVNTIESISDEQLRELVNEEAVFAHRQRALTPDSPVIRGTAQNPDVFFQAREAINGFYNATPDIVQAQMDRFAEVVGRKYELFDYTGDPEAEEVIVIMGSATETAQATSKFLNQQGRKTGVLKVRLYRPFSLKHFIAKLPKTVRKIAVLDRTKEPGAPCEPLHLDVIAALEEARATGMVATDFRPVVVGGRYGLGSKEFSPAMVREIYNELQKEAPKNHFTVGIVDDVTHLSLPLGETLDLLDEDVYEAVFVGLGADGTVGANKNTVKIIGTETDNYAQAYFVYDSKKSGAMTVSHLRFGPKMLQAPYLIDNARFVGCHQFSFLEKYDVLRYAADGAVLLINSVYGADVVWDKLNREVQDDIIRKGLKVYVIDAYNVAREAGMGGRINTIMQTCFFAISGILPREEAIAKIKGAIEKTYAKKGRGVVEKNFAAVDAALAHLHELAIPGEVTTTMQRPPIVSGEAPDFVQKVIGVMMAQEGDKLPVSAFPVDGTWPTATARWEKRTVALEVPTWDADICIQCNKCALVCPHAAIRSKFYPQDAIDDAPEGWQAIKLRSREFKEHLFTIQVAPEDCTGCRLCVNVCPAKDRKNPRHKAINMTPLDQVREVEAKKFDYFLKLPEPDPTQLSIDVKGTQFRQPLFEFSGACAGCGETPYVKLLSQMFGDRLLIANATGCSSIYGGNLPTTPFCVDGAGRGPAWSNSLFEDNAEFGYGFRFAIDFQKKFARDLLAGMNGGVDDGLKAGILEAVQTDEAGLRDQRGRVAELKEKLRALGTPEARRLLEVSDYLVDKSVWILGGDGWAYDIGYGGLDHVLASGKNVNVLVMDTEVYSNTGGQASKATPLAAVAKFAAAGKPTGKKNLGRITMSYGNIYVAQIAMGAKDAHTVKAFAEADSYDGPSLIIAYSHCIAHGFNLDQGMEHQKLAVDTGYWPLFSFDPRRAAEGKPLLKLDSPAPKKELRELLESEARYRMLQMHDRARADELAAIAQAQLTEQYSRLKKLAASSSVGDEEGAAAI